MKKMIGIILVLMIAATGFVFADAAGIPAKTAEGYLLMRIGSGEEESLALIGSGSGADVLEAFEFAAQDYAGRFDALWRVLSFMEPSLTLNGSVANLCFEPGMSGGVTTVTLNGVAVAQLKGLDVFAILSGDERPVVKADCDVRIWTAQSSGVTGEICINCGEPDDGSSRHDDEISQFCAENHTECMGDPVHHCDTCGRDYHCSGSGSHTPCAVCGKPWCDKSEGDHTAAACGHRGCQIYGVEEAHESCAICGGYLCDGEAHEAAECGLHHAADGGGHYALPCGHYACTVSASDAGKHAACENGDGFICDGGNHSHADELPEGDVVVEGDVHGQD